jgi:hypothetical protein
MYVSPFHICVYISWGNTLRSILRREEIYCDVTEICSEGLTFRDGKDSV